MPRRQMTATTVKMSARDFDRLDAIAARLGLDHASWRSLARALGRGELVIRKEREIVDLPQTIISDRFDLTTTELRDLQLLAQQVGALNTDHRASLSVLLHAIANGAVSISLLADTDELRALQAQKRAEYNERHAPPSFDE